MQIAYILREDWERDHISKALGDEHDLRFIRQLDELSPEEKQQIDCLSVFVKTRLSAEELSRFPRLKLIAVRATGFDNIDIKTCRERGITVTNVPGYGEHTVVEYTFALMLALHRRVYEAYKQVAETGSFSQECLRGQDLHGKHLGVIGVGRIGANVVKLAKAFGMHIIGYDPYPKPEFAEEVGFTYSDLDSVLRNSDILTLHAPYNQHTHHLINNQNYQLIKPNSYLINTARGGLVETQALVKALKEKFLAGAALDVLEEEGMIGDEVELLEDDHPNSNTLQTMLSNHYLIHHPRVLITPHNAFNTEEALRRILDTTINNIRSYQADQITNNVC